LALKGSTVAAGSETTGSRRSAEKLSSLIDDNGLPFADTSSPAFYGGLVVVSLAVISGLATFLILTGLTPIVPRSSVVVTVLLVNLVLIVAMIAMTTWQVGGLWRAWRENIAGARLHIRIVALFSLIAALPALLLAIAATTTFSRSLDGWFSNRTRTIIANSLDVANAYLEEHGQVIRTDIVNMAKDLDDSAIDLATGREKFRTLVFAQAGLRDLPVAYVIDRTGHPLVTVIENKNLPYRAPPEEVIKLAEEGQVPLLMPRDAYRVAAITKLQKYPGAYLFVARGVSPKVLGHLRRTQAGVDEYQQLLSRSGGLKIAHAAMYFMISLTALLAAIWIGMWFAGRFVAPIRRLIGAARMVSTGDMNVVLPIRKGEGDLRRLSQTFNTMTSELKTQRDALMNANTELRERQNFIEAVLSGVTAGVIGLDAEGRITLASRSAEVLLKISSDEVQGKRLDEVVPEFAGIFAKPIGKDAKTRHPDQVSCEIEGEERTFALTLTQEEATGTGGAVLTFDDITELVSAQRTSAWADVARRIAHEIKNPLTPIQLSAERLKRKYGQVLTQDREVFDKCTDTIIRQVGDVARMVDEFSSFARMPKPQMEHQDLRNAIKDAVTMFQMSDHKIKYIMDLPAEPVKTAIDRRLISQAMTNLVKNASESIQGLIESGEVPSDYLGKVETRLRVDADRAMIEVIDNGTGLSKQNRARLLEPYVTTKSKGTGLGLAIVQKVIEQHGGTLSLEDAAGKDGRDRGALVHIELPMTDTTSEILATAAMANGEAADGAGQS
jgi:two-component system, NtrC family, nitrogen regulation sensor histidine kinase NtrY